MLEALNVGEILKVRLRKLIVVKIIFLKNLNNLEK